MREHWYEGNAVDLLVNGEAFFPRVFNCIRAARREVLIETFIVWEDEVGMALQQALIDAATRGLRVEITVDHLGSPDLSSDYVTQLVDAGVKFHRFESKPGWMLGFNMLRRLHRKIVVIDGVMAFIGGINYSGDHLASFGPMAKQDYAVEVRGPVVADIHQACLKLLSSGASRAERRARARQLKQNPLPSGQIPVGAPGVAKSRAALALRDNHRHRNDIERHYLRAIRSARKRIVLANAYFFPGYRLLRALRNASRRGVEVVLILQGEPDMPWVSALSRLLYGYLLRDGVTIYEYCERPLHSKLALVDNDWSTVGSSNLDPLSLSLNLEANLMIEDAEFNQNLYDHLKDLGKAHCSPVTLQVAKVGYWWRLPLIILTFHFLRFFPALAGWLPSQVPALELVKSNKRSLT